MNPTTAEIILGTKDPIHHDVLKNILLTYMNHKNLDKLKYGIHVIMCSNSIYRKLHVKDRIITIDYFIDLIHGGTFAFLFYDALVRNNRNVIKICKK